MASYYSIIRYVPDPISEEAMNIGVAVFGSGGRPQFRFIEDWTRARQFGGERTDFLERFGRQVSSKQLGIFADSSEWDEPRLRSVLGRWHNSIQFTTPRTSLKEPSALMSEVCSAFLRETVKKGGRRGTRLNTEVRSLFQKMKVLGKTKRDVQHHRVVEDFPIDPRTGLFAEFALKNTVFHVMETIDYRSAAPSATAKFYETGAKALLLTEAREKLGRKTERYVIYSAHHDDKSAIKTYLALLENHADHVFNYDSKRDLAVFGSRVKKATSAELPL